MGLCFTKYNLQLIWLSSLLPVCINRLVKFAWMNFELENRVLIESNDSEIHIWASKNICKISAKLIS